MKTRIIKTKFWQDSNIKKLSKNARYLFLYLLTCPYVSLTCYFEISDGQIIEDTGLNKKELNDAKLELEKTRRSFFYDGWCFIPKLNVHNPYWKSEKTKKAYDDELKNIPKYILDYFKKKIDSTMYSTMDSTINSTPKTENINNKTENINEREIVKRENINQTIQEIISHFNQTLNKNYKTAGNPSNVEYWLKYYTLDDIKQAISLIPAHNFWYDKMTPTILFRRKNPKGQDVDYIGELINQERPRIQEKESYTDFEKRLEVFKKYGKKA